MGRLKVLDNLVLGPRLVCLVWGPSSLPNTRLCPILGSKNLDKMGLDKMRSDLSFSYEDVLSSLLNTTPCPLLGSKKPDRSTDGRIEGLTLPLFLGRHQGCSTTSKSSDFAKKIPLVFC